MEFARTSPKNLKLILTARRIDALHEVAAKIRDEVGEGVQILPLRLDVSKPDEVRGFVDSLPEDYKEIDILVNNAYAEYSNSLTGKYLLMYLSPSGLVKGIANAPDILEEDINVMFTTNVTGLISMTQAVLPVFKKREDGGKGDIINIGSVAGREPYAGGSIYCASKAAVRSFTDALRRELVATRIRVIEIDPGQVETVSVMPPPASIKSSSQIQQEFSIVRFYGDKAKADAVYAYVFRVLSRTKMLKERTSGCEPLTPDDIAEIVVFTAGRRENVVIADTLVFPNHQVGIKTTHP